MEVRRFLLAEVRRMATNALLRSLSSLWGLCSWLSVGGFEVGRQAMLSILVVLLLLIELNGLKSMFCKGEDDMGRR